MIGKVDLVDRVDAMESDECLHYVQPTPFLIHTAHS